MCGTSADANYNMHIRPEAAVRLIIRACIALFSGAVIVLVQSMFWTNAVSGSMRAIAIAMALFAYFRPDIALLALAVLTPLGQVSSRTLDSNMRGAEALVLAFLAGALLRGWTLHRFRSFKLDALLIAGFVFSGVAAASCITQLWLRMRGDLSASLARLSTYTIEHYLIALNGFDMITSAMLLLEGIALLIYVVHRCRMQGEFAYRLVASVTLGAVAATVVNFTYLGSYLAHHGVSVATARQILAQRWSYHVADLNAAASFFAMALFIAAGIAWRRGSRRAAWAAATVPIAIAFWLAGSRTGLIAVLLAASVLIAKLAAGRSLSIHGAAGVTLAALTLGGVIIAQLFPAAFFDATASSAVRVRWLFLGTTWRMLLDQPLFGVGVGQYARWSSHFSAPEMASYYTRENAHNNFAQIAGELGFAGLITFVWVLVIALWTSMRRWRSNAQEHPVVGPVAAGLAVFILTWLGGHPLLVPEVAYPFWLALGILPGLSTAATTPREPADA